MKLILIAMALQLGTQTKCDDTKIHSLIRAAKSCATLNAQRLSASGERADIIADAAVTKCDDSIEAARAYEGGCAGVRTGNALADELAKRMRQDALLRAVEIKSARHH